jgi:hypothetical protein
MWEHNSENKQESSTPQIIRTIRHDDAMNAFNTCYKWTEENNVRAQDILTLQIARKSFKRGIWKQKTEKFDAFFNAVKY